MTFAEGLSDALQRQGATIVPHGILFEVRQVSGGLSRCQPEATAHLRRQVHELGQLNTGLKLSVAKAQLWARMCERLSALLLTVQPFMPLASV